MTHPFLSLLKPGPANSLHKFLLTTPTTPQVPALRNKKKKTKAKMSVGESFAFLAASPYIRDLALLVRAQG